MRTSGAIAVGAVIGAAVVWLWGREMKGYVADKTRAVRAKAAEGIRAVEDTAGKVLDRSGDGLRRIDTFLRNTKQDVTGALRAGQDAIRPEPPVATAPGVTTT